MLEDGNQDDDSSLLDGSLLEDSSLLDGSLLDDDSELLLPCSHCRRAPIAYQVVLDISFPFTIRCKADASPAPATQGGPARRHPDECLSVKSSARPACRPIPFQPRCWTHQDQSPAAR